ncbi:hypothetical protein ICW40_01805 [Actinotalea ferrariae]|uniref:hypothetical protein n=1 Tax=Actinotalea ferrariae TaxID=1386098 RepID=UPI001C8B6156|nr:hypothetical protein [Actinotalea ferrariae]MBX9243540.1 hypothetical protein [Actinotalea ferrariae]
MTTPSLPTTVRSQADLELFWRTAMEPLGFSRPALWITFIRDGEPSGVLIEITDLPRTPQVEDLDGFAAMLDGIAAEHPGASAAILLARPGRGGVTGRDRTWAAGLRAAAERAHVAFEPVHLATDDTLVPVTPDDLAGVTA